MKVAQIINSLNVGGAEKLLVESISSYQLKGIKHDVILLNGNETILTKELHDIIDGSLYKLSVGSVYNPFLILKLIKYLRKYELVHIHLFPTLYWVVLAKIFSFSNVKLIYTEHSTNNKRRNNFFLKYIDRFIYSKLNIIVTIANEVDLEIKKHLNISNLSKFKLINNGVNLSKFRNADPYKKNIFFNEDDIILIQVSSFRYPKDQNTIIRSLKNLNSNYKLLLVGEGPLLDKSKDLVRNLNLDERVKFLGLRDDVPSLLKTSDIILLSSEYEGLSLSNIEGMCLDKPFIASNVPGIREVVKDYGILFEKGNSNELSNIIMDLENVDYYKLISEKCYIKSLEFDINIMVDKYIDLYKEILKK